MRVGGADAGEGGPCPHVVPAKVAGNHRDPIAAFQHPDIDGDGRRNGGEERVQVRRMSGEGRGDLGTMLHHFIEEVADPPDEDPRVPQATLAYHDLGALVTWLLDELGYATRA